MYRFAELWQVRQDDVAAKRLGELLLDFGSRICCWLVQQGKLDLEAGSTATNRNHVFRTTDRTVYLLMSIVGKANNCLLCGCKIFCEMTLMIANACLITYSTALCVANVQVAIPSPSSEFVMMQGGLLFCLSTTLHIFLDSALSNC